MSTSPPEDSSLTVNIDSVESVPRGRMCSQVECANCYCLLDTVPAPWVTPRNLGY